MATKRASSTQAVPEQDSSSQEETRVTKLLRELDMYMARQGLRSTEQRRVIVDTFVNSESHLTIEELLALVKQRDGRIGYATVYRTLKMLAESGIAHELHFGDGFARYELADAATHHDHLICTNCGTIVEFEEPEIEVLQDRIASRYGFAINSHRHELYGTCPKCLENGGKSAPPKRR
ncbi:MAG: transcriptional repressor [Polyangiaceae bacterium]